MTRYAQRADLLPGEVEMAYLVKFFRVLGDQNRLRLLAFLPAGERSVSDCVRQLRITQSRVSAHLACRVAATLVADVPVDSVDPGSPR